MRSRRGFIILVLIAVVLIFGAPILINLLSASGQTSDAPRAATITPDGL